MVEPPLCFVDGCIHTLLNLSPDLLMTDTDNSLNQNLQICCISYGYDFKILFI